MTTTRSKQHTDYERKYVQRYNFKLNKKTVDPETLAMWNAVDNKSACLQYMLDNYLMDYLVHVQGLSYKDIDKLTNFNSPEAKERRALDKEKREKYKQSLLNREKRDEEKRKQRLQKG